MENQLCQTAIIKELVNLPPLVLKDRHLLHVSSSCLSHEKIGLPEQALGLGLVMEAR